MRLEKPSLHKPEHRGRGVAVGRLVIHEPAPHMVREFLVSAFARYCHRLGVDVDRGPRHALALTALDIGVIIGARHHDVAENDLLVRRFLHPRALRGRKRVGAVLRRDIAQGNLELAVQDIDDGIAVMVPRRVSEMARAEHLDAGSLIILGLHHHGVAERDDVVVGNLHGLLELRFLGVQDRALTVLRP